MADFTPDIALALCDWLINYGGAYALLTAWEYYFGEWRF